MKQNNWGNQRVVKNDDKSCADYGDCFRPIWQMVKRQMVQEKRWFFLETLFSRIIVIVVFWVSESQFLDPKIKIEISMSAF